MNTLYDQVKAHQQATDCSDADMLAIICSWMSIPVINRPNLEEHLVECLERLPGDIPVPAWQLPMFTDQDREAIVSSMMDELADESLKDRAHEALEHLSLVETIGYVFPDDMEPLVEMLQRIDNKGDEEYITGEFLREHNDEDDYDTMLDFAVRMSLLNDDETELTDLGRQFVSEFS